MKKLALVTTMLALLAACSTTEPVTSASTSAPASATATLAPSVTAAPSSTATVAPPVSSSATTSKTPGPTTAKPSASKTTQSKTAADERSIIIGNVAIVLPEGYGIDPTTRFDDVVVAVGVRDEALVGNRTFPAILRVSTKQFTHLPLVDNDLVDGSCSVKRRPASIIMAGSTGEMVRETYTCSEAVYTYVSWESTAFRADYFFMGDRLPSELTEAFEAAALMH